MDATSIERAIRDCGVPAKLVELDGRLIKLDVLDEHTEKVERHVLSRSEFSDLVLDWRARLVARDVIPAAAPRRAEVLATTAA
jgi:hypothetical protein